VVEALIAAAAPYQSWAVKKLRMTEKLSVPCGIDGNYACAISLSPWHADTPRIFLLPRGTKASRCGTRCSNRVAPTRKETETNRKRLKRVKKKPNQHLTPGSPFLEFPSPFGPSKCPWPSGVLKKPLKNLVELRQRCCCCGGVLWHSFSSIRGCVERYPFYAKNHHHPLHLK
jgi:hypothetical protein